MQYPDAKKVYYYFFVYLLFNVSLENISLLWRRYHYLTRAESNAYDQHRSFAGRELYRATSARIQVLMSYPKNSSIWSLFTTSKPSRWLSGRVFASHAGDRGSSPVGTDLSRYHG